MNLIPIYVHQTSNPHRYYYDTQPSNNSGWSEGAIAFYAYGEQAPGRVPIYWHRKSTPVDAYCYDKQVLKDGWSDGEVAFYAYGVQEPGTVPIYGYHYQATNDNLYYYDMENSNEPGWSKGDVAFYAYATSTVDVMQWWCQCFSWEQEELFQQNTNKRAAFRRGVLWKQYTEITYSVKKGDKEKEKIIDAAFAEWNKVGMNISFKKISKWQDADIRIEMDDSRADNSMLGNTTLTVTDRTISTMNLGMRKGMGSKGHVTALHEIGHAIGLVHEHERIDSGIKWNREGVYNYFANRQPIPITDRAKIDKAVFGIENDFQPVKSGDQFPYDSKSVMNYDFEAQCFDEPEELRKNGIVRSEHLTETDKETARYFYPQDKELRSAANKQKIDNFEVYVNNGNFNVRINGIVGENAYIALHEKNKELKYNDYVIYYYLYKIFDYKSIKSDDFEMIEVSGSNWIKYNASSEMRLVIWDSTPSNHTIAAQYICLIPSSIEGKVEYNFSPAPDAPYPKESSSTQYVASFRAFLNNSDWNIELEGVFSNKAWVGLYYGREALEQNSYSKYDYISNFELTINKQLTTDKNTSLVHYKGSYWFNDAACSDCYFVIWDVHSQDQDEVYKGYVYHIPKTIQFTEEKNY